MTSMGWNELLTISEQLIGRSACFETTHTVCGRIRAIYEQDSMIGIELTRDHDNGTEIFEVDVRFHTNTIRRNGEVISIIALGLGTAAINLS